MRQIDSKQKKDKEYWCSIVTSLTPTNLRRHSNRVRTINKFYDIKIIRVSTP